MKKNFFGKLFRFALVLSLKLVCIYMFLNSAFFSVDKITYTGLNRLKEAEMKQLCKFTTGTNIFRLDSEFYAKDYAVHPMIKEVSIIKHIPRHIEVNITERVAWAVMPYKSKFLLIDDEGVCIDQAVQLEQLEYPIITLDKMPENVYLGQPVNSQGVTVVKKVWDQLNDAAKNNSSDFHYITEKEELIIYTTRGTEVRFGNLDRLDEKAAFLTQLIKIEDDMQNEGREVLQYIDLRFKGQPVIKVQE